MRIPTRQPIGSSNRIAALLDLLHLLRFEGSHGYRLHSVTELAVNATACRAHEGTKVKTDVNRTPFSAIETLFVLRSGHQVSDDLQIAVILAHRLRHLSTLNIKSSSRNYKYQKRE